MSASQAVLKFLPATNKPPRLRIVLNCQDGPVSFCCNGDHELDVGHNPSVIAHVRRQAEVKVHFENSDYKCTLAVSGDSAANTLLRAME